MPHRLCSLTLCFPWNSHRAGAAAALGKHCSSRRILSTGSAAGTVCLRKCSVTAQVHREASCDNRLGLWLLLSRLSCVFARSISGSRAGRNRGQPCLLCKGSSLNRSLIACTMVVFGCSKSLLRSCAVVLPFLTCSILPLCCP